MIKSHAKFHEDKITESLSFGAIMLGVALAYYGIKAFMNFTRGIALTSELSKDMLHTIVEKMTNDAANEKGMPSAGMLKQTDARIWIDDKIENGEIKTCNDIRKYLKLYVSNQTEL